MQHPDLAIVQADQIGGTLKVDQVRELQRGLALSPYEAPYRVAVLLRFEEANPNAANALLKTLEEPNPQVVLIVTAQDAESLLPTIVSRCEVIRLRPLPIDMVKEGLQSRWGMPPEQAQLLAHVSRGRPGYALYLHQHPEALELRQTWLDHHRNMLKASRVERFAYADDITDFKKEKSYVREGFQIWLTLWRDVMLLTAGASTPVTNLDRSEEIHALAKELSLSTAQKVILDLERTLNLLDRNINRRLAAEVFLMDLPRVNESLLP
jgi:DNA polymerase-3 subunit delta'